MDALQAHRHRHVPAAVVEQLILFRRADHMARQCSRLKPALLIKLTEMRNRLLNNAPAKAHAANQRPIAMDLPSLASCRVAQIHQANHI